MQDCGNNVYPRDSILHSVNGVDILSDLYNDLFRILCDTVTVREYEVTTKHYMYVCDICGHESTNMNICNYCKHHICGNHTNRLSNDHPITGCDYGDYPDRICGECYQIIKSGDVGELIKQYKQAELEND